MGKCVMMLFIYKTIEDRNINICIVDTIYILSGNISMTWCYELYSILLVHFTLFIIHDIRTILYLFSVN